MIIECLHKHNSFKVLKNGVLFSLFSFINRGFGFLLLLVLANYISPAEYGYLNLFNTCLMVLGYFISMSTDGFLSIAYFQKGHDVVGRVFANVLMIVAIVGSLIFFSILIAGDSISSILELSPNILVIAVIISVFTVFVNMNLDIVRIHEQTGHYGILSVGNAVLNFILSILLIKYLAYGWEGRVYAQTISFSIFFVVCIFYLWRKHLFSFPDIKLCKEMLIWSIPLIPHLATNFIRQGCDRYIISSYHSIEDVGLFSFALNLANIIIMIGMGFNQSNSVDIYKVLGDSQISKLNKMDMLSKQRKPLLWIYMTCTLIVAIVVYFLVPYIMPKYEKACNYFLILAIYGFLFCLYFLYTNYLFFYKDTKKIMFVTFTSSIIHLTASLFLTKYSLYATCIIYCISQLLVVCLIRHFALRRIHKELVIEKKNA